LLHAQFLLSILLNFCSNFRSQFCSQFCSIFAPFSLNFAPFSLSISLIFAPFSLNFAHFCSIFAPFSLIFPPFSLNFAHFSPFSPYIGVTQFTSASREDKLRFAFWVFDFDGSGAVSKDEMAKMLKSFHLASDKQMDNKVGSQNVAVVVARLDAP
jgi:hypothetical protein